MEHMQPEVRAAVVTVSDGVAEGSRVDESGDAAASILRGFGYAEISRAVVPDERREIEPLLRELAATHALVVTTGGTGFGPRDLTPEGTAALIERDAPGLAEAMRAANPAKGRLSRGRAGVVGTCLVLNTPGSAGGATESLGAVIDVLPHALSLLGAWPTDHPA
jgi:molybdopterin adenylyltransferase